MIRTGRVPDIPQRGDKRTASESPGHDRTPLRRKAASRAIRQVWGGIGDRTVGATRSDGVYSP